VPSAGSPSVGPGGAAARALDGAASPRRPACFNSRATGKEKKEKRKNSGDFFGKLNNTPAHHWQGTRRSWSWSARKPAGRAGARRAARARCCSNRSLTRRPRCIGMPSRVERARGPADARLAGADIRPRATGNMSPAAAAAARMRPDFRLRVSYSSAAVAAVGAAAFGADCVHRAECARALARACRRPSRHPVLPPPTPAGCTARSSARALWHGRR
jgi:hypothetical protein